MTLVVNGSVLKHFLARNACVGVGVVVSIFQGWGHVTIGSRATEIANVRVSVEWSMADI